VTVWQAPPMRPEADDARRPPRTVRRAGWCGVALSVVVFAALASGGTVGGLLERGPFSSDFFDEQAEVEDAPQCEAVYRTTSATTARAYAMPST